MSITNVMNQGMTRRGFVGASVIACLAAAGLVSFAGEAHADEAQTRTVTDARGEVEIPANPQRIVDLSGNSDMLKIFGFDVVGTANSDAYDYTKFPAYLEEDLAGARFWAIATRTPWTSRRFSPSTLTSSSSPACRRRCTTSCRACAPLS